MSITAFPPRKPVKAKPAACLTLIESPQYGTCLFGPLDGATEPVHTMLDEMNITRRHKAQNNCRGPRPKTP